MEAQNRSEWTNYDPSKIPTKPDLSHVDRWVSTLSLPARVLDIGCGTGGVSRFLLDRGCEIVGIDINRPAIEALSHEFRENSKAVFYVRDVASLSGFDVGDLQFDGAVCQLVMSIVGDASDRIQLLKNIHSALSPSGKLSISFSGLSNDINPVYAALYEADLPLTGEYGTYLSRDDKGDVLYETHHFAREELQKLLQDQGFHAIHIEEKIEASSRRPEQAARFYYVMCERQRR